MDADRSRWARLAGRSLHSGRDAAARAHVASARARYDVLPKRLWAVIAELGHRPEWNTAVRRMERQPGREGRSVWVAAGSSGTIPSALDVFELPRPMRTRMPEDAGIGFRGSSA